MCISIITTDSMVQTSLEKPIIERIWSHSYPEVGGGEFLQDFSDKYGGITLGLYTFIRRCLVLISVGTPVILAGIFSWSFSVAPGKFRKFISISPRLLFTNLLQVGIYQSS
jgi:hypothetical protein